VHKVPSPILLQKDNVTNVLQVELVHKEVFKPLVPVVLQVLIAQLEQFIQRLVLMELSQVQDKLATLMHVNIVQLVNIARRKN
jgi:hypothetical protein